MLWGKKSKIFLTSERKLCLHSAGERPGGKFCLLLQAGEGVWYTGTRAAPEKDKKLTAG